MGNGTGNKDAPEINEIARALYLALQADNPIALHWVNPDDLGAKQLIDGDINLLAVAERLQRILHRSLSPMD